MKFNSQEQRQKAVLLGGLYTSQTLGLAFVTTAAPVILRQSSVGLDKISLIFVLGFCWSIKFLWAPLIDRYGSKKYGHYRSWILVLQMLMIIVTIGSSFFSINGQLTFLSLLFVLLTIFSATQDIAADGLAVTILKPEERGIGSSIQSAGNMIGFMIGGGIVLIAYQWLGWRGCLLAHHMGTTWHGKNLFDEEYDPDGYYGGMYTIYSDRREVGLQAVQILTYVERFNVHGSRLKSPNCLISKG